jgi:hypothetical protein
MTSVRVAYVTNVIPHYREAFFRELFKRPELDVTVYCQQSIPGMNLTTVHQQFPERVRLVRAASRAREHLAWQWLPWRELLNNYDVLFVRGNPRVVSNVLFASFARLINGASGGSVRPGAYRWCQSHHRMANTFDGGDASKGCLFTPIVRQSGYAPEAYGDSVSLA